MGTVRRCRWCRLVIDERAPANGHLVAGNYDGVVERRVRPHCPDSSSCDWCQPCVTVRGRRAESPGEVTQEIPAVPDEREEPPSHGSTR